MKHKPIIATNDGSKGKYETYKFLMERYKKAVSNEYFLEAMWTVYAMLEDRTTSLLFYLGFVNGENKEKATKKVIVNGNREENENNGNLKEIIDIKKYFNFNNLNGKLRAISKAIEWAESDKIPVNPYYVDLRKSLLDSDLTILKKELNSICIWKDKRNEMTHSLFNKDYLALSSEWRGLAETGLKGVREIDKLVKTIKKAALRKKHKIL